MLNRTDPKPKERLLEECNIRASIQLPRNSFFNTSQKTYILVLEKRHTAADARPDVLCAIARSIGESLDWRRIPLPKENDLDIIASEFISIVEGVPINPKNGLVKIRSATDFTANDRWDVTRFWSDDELVKLGEKDSTVDRVAFIDDARETLDQIMAELDTARSELAALTSTSMATLSLNDSKIFVVRAGDRITSDEIRQHPGEVPVYSCFKDAKIVKGAISEAHLNKRNLVIEGKPVVTVNANGASVGKVFVRNERCTLTDDVIAVDVLRHDIDPDYFAIALRTAVAQGGFLYEAKLFAARVRELEIRVPVEGKGTFDLQQQRLIAAAVKRIENIRQQIAEMGEWSRQARII